MSEHNKEHPPETPETPDTPETQTSAQTPAEVENSENAQPAETGDDKAAEQTSESTPGTEMGSGQESETSDAPETEAKTETDASVAEGDDFTPPEELEDEIADADLVKVAKAQKQHRKKAMRRKRWVFIFVSMFVFSLPLILVIAYYAPSLIRDHKAVSMMESDDPEKVEIAYKYIVNNVKENENLKAQVVEQLLNEDDPERRSIYRAALNEGGVWGPNLGQVWSIAQKESLENKTESMKVSTALSLRRLAINDHPVSKLPETAHILELMMNDDSASVRREALAATVVYPAALRDPILVKATQDPHWQIASEAWLYISLIQKLTVSPEFPNTKADLPPAISAENIERIRAMLRAKMTHQPEHWELVLELANDENMDISVRGYAWALLRGQDDPRISEAAVKMIDVANGHIDDPELFLAWRAMIGAPVKQDPNDPVARSIARFLVRSEAFLDDYDALYEKENASGDEKRRMVAMERVSVIDYARAAGIARIATIALTSDDELFTQFQPGWTHSHAHRMYNLVFWENAPKHSLTLPEGMNLIEKARNERWPNVVRAYAGVTYKDTKAQDMRGVFRFNEGNAFVTGNYFGLTAHGAVNALDSQQYNPYIQSIVGVPFDPTRQASLFDDERIGAALMLALGPGDVTILDPWLREQPQSPTHLREPSWRVAQYYKLAKLTRAEEITEKQMTEMLARVGADVRVDHLALVLMRMGRSEAFTLLMNHEFESDQLELQEGQHPVHMIDLLGRYGFWLIGSRYLPPEIRDLYSSYADPQLKIFQVARFQAWYRMYGHRLSFDKQAEHFVQPVD